MKTVYLLFCECCGSPKHITPYIMIMYVQQEAVDHIYCDNCKYEQKIPAYLKNIVPDLLK